MVRVLVRAQDPRRKEQEQLGRAVAPGTAPEQASYDGKARQERNARLRSLSLLVPEATDHNGLPIADQHLRECLAG